jgi:ribosomal protein S18 acetylase RimI-like enzyme
MVQTPQFDETDRDALDNPVWAALNTRQAGFAAGSGLARRYHPEVAPFGAVREPSAQAFEALRELAAGGAPLIVLSLGPLPPLAQFQAQSLGTAFQMVATDFEPGPPGRDFVRLGAADAPDMQRLAALTKPGPFARRTHELGEFIGIRVQGELVAMAGERMKLRHWVEVSAVCVHPQHRGAGHARALMRAVTGAIVARNELPFLHVFTVNTSAIALYEQLGYRKRQVLEVFLLAPDPSAP